VLDPVLLDPEPVAVVEVRERLEEREDALGASPVVDLAARLGPRDQLVEQPRLLDRRSRGRRADPKRVLVRVKRLRFGSGLLRARVERQRAAE
jgi:hypothetical protein